MPSNASVIVRAEIPAGPEVLSHAMTAITMAGGEVSGMDAVRSTRETITRDIVIEGPDDAAIENIIASLKGVTGVTVCLPRARRPRPRSALGRVSAASKH